MSEHYFMGIDPSLGSTGVVIFKDPQDPIVANTHNILPFESDNTRFSTYLDLLEMMAEDFEEILFPFELKYETSAEGTPIITGAKMTDEVFVHVMIERALFRVPRKRAAELFELNTVIQNHFMTGRFFSSMLKYEEFGFKCDTIYPSAFKKEMTGNGKATKAEMAETLKVLTKKTYKGKGSTDLVDAHLLAYLAYDRFHRRNE